MSDNGSRSRRDLLTGWMDMFRGVSTAATGTTKHNPEELLRPPGALKPDEDFVAACTGCGDCIPVCPTSSIFTVEHEDGRQIPVIAPSTKACYLCTDLPCGNCQGRPPPLRDLPRREL
jgi:formate hydrogenlyase subunit 6/NADH:ubiquinone oxidoreductase subunit I